MHPFGLHSETLSKVQNSAASPSNSHKAVPAKKVELDGFHFDSKKEAERYQELKLLQMSGEIQSLKVHPKYRLKVNGLHVCDYIADFEYLLSVEPDEDSGIVTEDVKGAYRKGGAWEKFRIKAKLFRAIMGYDVTVWPEK